LTDVSTKAVFSPIGYKFISLKMATFWRHERKNKKELI
jgi:hypothetical protein